MPKVGRRIVDALEELADARYVYVREKPKYELDAKQKAKLKKHLTNAKKIIQELEKKIK